MLCVYVWLTIYDVDLDQLNDVASPFGFIFFDVSRLRTIPVPHTPVGVRAWVRVLSVVVIVYFYVIIIAIVVDANSVVVIATFLGATSIVVVTTTPICFSNMIVRLLSPRLPSPSSLSFYDYQCYHCRTCCGVPPTQLGVNDHIR